MSSTPQPPTGATPPPPQQQQPSQPATSPQPQPEPPSAQPQVPPEPQPDGTGPAPDEGSGDAPPSSPPLPAKPVAAAPGPRAARLQQLYTSTLNHTLDKVVRGGNFGACFPTVQAKAPGTLEAVQRQFVERLRGRCETEFTRILQSRAVVPKLNELETLLLDAQARKERSGEGGEPPVPPHTLPAPVILAAHLAPHLNHHQQLLSSKLSATQAQNAQLFSEIQAQRAEIEALLAGVEGILADMDAASGLLEEVVGELVEETRSAEAGDIQMGGV